MTYPAITASPPAPQRTQAGDAYAAVADTWAAYVEELPDELNALAEWFEDTVATLVSSGLSATSSASITIGTGSKSFAASAGSAFTPGQSVVIASTANPANSMTGQITAYDSGTGNITVNVASVTGSGTFASWTIGLALVADLSAYLAKAGGTMTGLLTLAAAQGLLLTPGSAPASPADGQIWRETNKLRARVGAVSFEVVLDTLAQTLTNKTLTAPISTGDIQLNGSARGNKTAFTGGAVDCSLGNYFTSAISANTALAFSNVPANSYACTLKVNWTGGVITLPAGVKLLNGKALKYVSGVWHFVFSTDDGGTTWELVAGQFA